MTAKYYTYQEMWDELHRLEEQYPDFVQVEVIGKSRQGRDIAGVTLTNRKTGDPSGKSAVFVDANIHAGEVSGNAVAMYWMDWCLSSYGKDPEATELLDAHTAYVVPRIAVDGAELYMTTPARFRSSPHTYPYSEAPEGFIQDDVNGDGHILQMRVPAEDGGFVIDDVDPRVMRPRRPGEIGGTYYHVFPEGRIDRLSQTGSLPAYAKARDARRTGMDFNRNFPIRWAGESGQPGAGPFPLSEPELRSLAEFILAHPNIAAYVALHTTGGVILRQPSTGDDTILSPTDRNLFTRVAEMGAKASGYHTGSNYKIFATGHEKILMPGAADDWMYDHFGVLSFTLEIWDLSKRAGAHGYGEIGMRRMMELTPEQDTEDERKIYAWADKEVGAKGVFPWTVFEHPDFGTVEIGGLDPKFVLQNPPHHMIEEECRNVGAFLTKLGLSTAKLFIPSISVVEEGEGLYRIVAEVSNAGFLPTSSTDKGKSLLLEGIRAFVEGDVEVVAGESPTPIGHLSGYGSQSSWTPPKNQRAYAEWVVRGEKGTQVTVKFSGPRAGSVSQTVSLQG
ncbi:M14 family metallopeptidase [Alicyclobacillus ferrooxydans]|uniref:Peptidase M14 n=1 Tax=Alicyclobacillus ferrooxydans TaxID=471514 RepID=A0A0P9CR31_9BACL|nr:M14 family metallopeptidase [Alicyclobacillus ferrooxydans]KPV41816.1 peptidase M14 [Alicyclobacillus ferrooxydans]